MFKVLLLPKAEKAFARADLRTGTQIMLHCHTGRTCLLGLILTLVAADRTFATDVAFWNEYRAEKLDAEQTYLLLQFNESPLSAQGAVERLAHVGQPAVVEGGRFGKGLKLDGRSALRCVTNRALEGGSVSIEAWIKLDRYPEKEGCVVFRPAVVDQNAAYDPQVDRSKGFALSVDSRGALHMDITNTFYGRRTRTSSEAAAVPLRRWVHVAGVCGKGRALFVDGRPLADRPIHWGEGLEVQSERESEPQPVYVGNNDQGTAGLTGLVDQVRVHRNVHKFWAPEDDGWTDPKASRQPAVGLPHFVAAHVPAVYVPLDGNATAVGSAAAKVELAGSDFRPGVRGQAFAGRVTVSAPGLFRSDEGSVEFWLRPLGVNNLSDRNWSFLSEPFIFYLLNGGQQEPTLYFNVKDAGLHFVHAPLEVQPARWYHFVLAWRDKEISIYADGKLAGRTTTQRLAPNGQTTADRFVFNGHSVPSLIDEIRIYHRALLPEEAANAYWRCRDPAKLVGGVQLPAVEIAAEYLPSRNRVYYELSPRMPAEEFAQVAFELRDEKDAVLQRWERAWAGEGARGRGKGDSPVFAEQKLGQSPSCGELSLPKLSDGNYRITTVVTTKAGKTIPGRSFGFYARGFPWEGNTLGITDEVYPPFTPVKVQGRTASVVSRSMTMNGFGLCDEVVSLGRNLLAAPMSVRFETAAGEGRWTTSGGKFVKETPKVAVFEAAAESAAVAVRTRTSIEIDGCMKIEMRLAPGRQPAEIRRLWIDIPLKDAETPLMHAIGDGLRQNVAGSAPAGEGAIWDGSRAARSEPWRNAFVPYVWLGAAERGLALFAENDRGWITGKHKSKTPTHELIRKDGRLTLRAYLINRPVTLGKTGTGTSPDAASPASTHNGSEPVPVFRDIVFGLQASPTKPLPADWRKRLPHAPGGLAVVPWGGIQCASQGPWGDDWTIVEKILAVRRGEKFDEAWLDDYVREHRPPKVHNDADWAYYVNHFVQRAKDVGPQRPLAVYQEEMRAAHSRPEWIVYQDEWKTADGPAARTPPDGLDLRGGHRSFSGISEITFVRSYADFGAWMANEWLRRGVSLYWDNTYLYPTYNCRTTAAYLTEDGHVQPALTIWNVRAYHQRVWQLLQQHRRRRSEPLEWTLHMTNTEVLPVHTWGSVQLDHELDSKRPFTPEWLLTETIGRQTGNLPLSHYAVAGSSNEIVKRLPKEQAERIEWGLRAVHEIQRSGPQEKLLTDFGYGDEGLAVHNYWADRPVLRVSPPAVKWLALSKPGGEMLIVLAAWSEAAVDARVEIDAKTAGLGDAAKFRLLDAETGKEIAASAAGPLKIDIPGPWGNRVLRVAR